jgi:hypothetical protein
MTESDSAVDPFVEAEIKEHQAALIRDMVAVVIIVCVMLTLAGTASLIINTARGLVGWLTVAFESSISPSAFRYPAAVAAPRLV